MRFGNKIIKKNRSKILLLSSSLLVDRVFLYTNLIETLKQSSDVTIWATSVGNNQNSSIWNETDVKVENFPKILPFREFPYNFLRRLNEFIWDYRFPLPSRTSMRRHVRNKQQNFLIRALKLPARFLAMLRTEKSVENKVEKLLLSYPRSDEAEERLRQLKPDVIVTTGPFQFEQPAIFAAAKKLGIPTLAYIPSWDNITTKNRMLFKYDGYIVWSEQIKKELHEVYQHTKNQPVYIVGAPQYDIFKQDKFYQSREEFCEQQCLNPELPIIVYAIGSPNFLKEHHGAIDFAERVFQGELGKVQMIVRPHPIHDNAELHAFFDKFAPNVRLQQTPNAGKTVAERSQDKEQITEWVNTFRHADVVVNLSSTVTIDAAIFEHPVVNLDFDPQPGQSDQELIKDINHKWNHFQPIAESGGVWLVNNLEETVSAVKNYLKNPNLHQAKRRWMTQYVCGYLDGKCGERMAHAIKDFSEKNYAENRAEDKIELNYKVAAQF
ncbi:MAG: CDP-glycerol glycerophosphotransferase family protein [Actinomycetota bacterium]